MERDDLILDHSYSIGANHDEEHGKQMRKMILKVTIILTVITCVEVGLGMTIKQGTDWWPVVKWSFLIMTLVKAGYIVMEFMHLGGEKKSFKWMLFAPYFIFLSYLVFQCLTEATYQGDLIKEASGATKTEMPVKEAAASHSEH
jgi:cytochrome c oxidase subunit IV